METSDLEQSIRAAFGWRQLPSRLLRDMTPKHYLPPDHPAYGITDPLQEEALYAEQYLTGRDWREADALKLEWLVFYLSADSFIYYLPAILLFNVANGHLINTIDCTLLGWPSCREWRTVVSALMTVEEREAICLYMEHLGGDYSQDQVAFWRSDSSGVIA